MAEGWTQVFSHVSQDHPLGCPFPVTFNRITRQLPPTLNLRDKHEALCWPESLNFLFSESPHHSTEQEGENFPFSTRTSSVLLFYLFVFL